MIFRSGADVMKKEQNFDVVKFSSGVDVMKERAKPLCCDAQKWGQCDERKDKTSRLRTRTDTSVHVGRRGNSVQIIGAADPPRAP